MAARSSALPYGEGDLFALPLADSGYLLGLIARVAPRGRVISVYVFDRLLAEVPPRAALPPPECVFMSARVGDLGLIKGEWPVVTREGAWHRTEWPIPVFGRVEPISGRAWRVEYRNEDPNSRPKEMRPTGQRSRHYPPTRFMATRRLKRSHPRRGLRPDAAHLGKISGSATEAIPDDASARVRTRGSRAASALRLPTGARYARKVVAHGVGMDRSRCDLCAGCVGDDSTRTAR